MLVSRQMKNYVYRAAKLPRYMYDTPEGKKALDKFAEIVANIQRKADLALFERFALPGPKGYTAHPVSSILREVGVSPLVTDPFEKP